MLTKFSVPTLLLCLVPSLMIAAARPNIVFIYADDHAEAAISACGSKINRTPNIDRLCSGAMRFRNSFVANSICSPARATILTGTHSHINKKMRARNVADLVRMVHSGSM